jgi:hypothetical protein
MQLRTPETLFVEVQNWPKVGLYELVARLAESLGLEAAEDDGPGLGPSQLAELERRLDSSEPGIPAEQALAEIREHSRVRREALNQLPPDRRPRPPQDIEQDALRLEESDRRKLARRLAGTLANDPWYTDEMRALDQLLGEPAPEA